MNPSTQHLYEEALHLDLEARTALTGLLLESLEAGPEEGAEAAWWVEIDRRIAEMDAGLVPTVSWEAVRARLYNGA